MITRQVDDIHHLVNEFSSFARMPSPKLKLINIHKVVIDCIKPIVTTHDDVRFIIDDFKENAFIMGDEKQVRQACNNIVKNSYENIILNNIKNGLITILFSSDNNFVSIIFNDNGTGIKKSMISKITEPYYTTKTGNTGLGLAITKKIIDDHNGIMLIKKIKKFRGTSVTFKFPLLNKKKS